MPIQWAFSCSDRPHCILPSTLWCVGSEPTVPPHGQFGGAALGVDKLRSVGMNLHLAERSCLPYGKAPLLLSRSVVDCASVPLTRQRHFGYSSHRGGVGPADCLSFNFCDPASSFIEPPNTGPDIFLGKTYAKLFDNQESCLFTTLSRLAG
jgi:hypothetical protein